MTALLALALFGGGLGVVAWAGRQLLARTRETRLGQLVAVDVGDGRALTLRSSRYRLVGRPDAVRSTRDGTLVPVEVKRRVAPREGTLPSHVAQLWAYCLLLEETTGRAPPFGVLRYSDRDVRVDWDAPSRAELFGILRELDRPYDGRADPSVAKCRGCRFVRVCDARAPGLKRVQ